jgi:hypothetical protein
MNKKNASKNNSIGDIPVATVNPSSSYPTQTNNIN